MKKGTKLISLLLAGAMLFACCSCSKPKGNARVIEENIPSKPESHSSEPVETTPTTTAASDPTDPADPTPAPSVPTGTGNTFEMTIGDVMYISELCIGLDVEAATYFLTTVYGIGSYNASDSNYGSNGAPMERFLRDLDVDIIVEGITFKSIGIHSLDDGTVHSIDYTMRKTAIFASDESFDSKGAYNTLYPALEKKYGDPSDDYYSSWVDFDESGMNGWRYNDNCWISIFWGVSCQGKKGNDQLVIGFECENPYDYASTQPTGTSPVPTATRGDYDGEIAQVYDMMESTTGLDRNMAASVIQNYFGVTLSNPTSREGSEDGQIVYTYYANVTICGIDFNQIEISTNSWGAVFHVGFMNTKDSADTIHQNVLKLVEEVNAILGEPTIDYPLTSDNSVIEFYDHDLDPNIVVSVGGYYSDGYNSLWFYYDDNDMA